MTVFFFEIYLNTCPAGTVDGSLKLLDLLELTQKGFHLTNQHIHLLKRTSVGKRGIDVKHHLTLVTVKVTSIVYLLGEQTQRTAQHLIYNGFHIFLIGIVIKNRIIPFRPFPLLFRIFNFLGKHKYRKAKSQYQHKKSKSPISAQQNDHIPIETCEVHRPPFYPHTDVSGLSFGQTDLLNHRRNEEQGNQQGYTQVDNYHSCKVLKVQTDLLIQEENDHQCTDRGQRSSQNRHECLQVASPQDMIGHDNNIVDHQVQ